MADCADAVGAEHPVVVVDERLVQREHLLDPDHRVVRRADLLVGEEASFVDLRNQFIRIIKATADIVQEIKDVYDQLQEG